MAAHIVDGLAQRRVRFNYLLIELRIEPLFKFFHQRFTVSLMIFESLSGRHLLGFGNLIVFVHLAKGFDYIAAFVGKVPDYINEFAAGMSETIGQYGVFCPNPRKVR